MGTTTYFANSKKHLLSEHCALIGLLSEKLLIDTYPKAPDPWRNIARWSGFLHDIGKMDPNFQRFIHGAINEDDGAHIEESKKFSWNDYPRHNEVSWLMLTGWFSQERTRAFFGQYKESFDTVRYAVYWHHAKPLRDHKKSETFKNSTSMCAIPEMSWPQTDDTGAGLKQLLSEIVELSHTTCLELPVMNEYIVSSELIPVFKASYSDDKHLFDKITSALEIEALRSAIRSCVIGADRIVSAMDAQTVQEWLSNYSINRELPSLAPSDYMKTKLALLNKQISDMIEKFENNIENKERNDTQHDATIELDHYPLSVLEGPAGCGKTNIILQYIAKQKDRRTFIFVPRVAIGHGLFTEFIEEYGVTSGLELYTGDMKLRWNPESKKIENTPEKECLCGAIVITTIDQLCSIALSHTNIDLLTEIMRSTVVFDEFHELFDIAGIILMFLEFMKLRIQTDFSENSVRTLLVSATPNLYLLNWLEQLNTEIDNNKPLLTKRICKVKTFNVSPYFLEKKSYNLTDERHPFQNGIALGEIAISNTVRVAQASAIASLHNNINTLCFHSKYTPEHKQTVMHDVLKHFGKTSGSTTHALFAGPIVQASLNISTRVLHTEVPTAENFLQRLGRVNRFSTFPSGKIILYDCINEQGKSNQVDTKTLGSMHQAQRAKAWLDWCITEKLYKKFVLADMYIQYNLFHTSEAANAAYIADFKKIIASSAILFKNNIFDPITYPKTSAKSDKKILSSSSLRGRSYYILPMEHHIVNNAVVYKDWLYKSTCPSSKMLTDELNFLFWSPESDVAFFLEYMHSSDPNILMHRKKLDPALNDLLSKKRKLSLVQWRMKARSPQFPLVVTCPGTPEPKKLEKIYLKYENTWIGLVPHDPSIFNPGVKEKEIL